jgi:hypothetical protein
LRCDSITSLQMALLVFIGLLLEVTPQQVSS